MKVLFFHRWVGVHGGGTETHLLELANRFCRLGHDVSILTRQGNRLGDIDSRIKVIRVSKNWHESDHSYSDWRVYFATLLFMVKSLSVLIKLWIIGQRFEIVSVHFATEAMVARLWRWLTKTPYIFVLEGYTPMEAKAARWADGRISISDYEAKKYLLKDNVKSELIYIGVDLNKFKKNQKRSAELRSQLIADNDFLILTVCRLEPRKDLFTLLRAAKRAQDEKLKIKFVIAGDGISRKELEEEIGRQKLEATVHLAGFVADADLVDYYGAADIFLLTSKEEWFGIVFLEAMACGLPILSTNVDACPEVIGKAGLFFDKGNDKQLEERITLIMNDSRLRKTLAAEATKRADKFSWEKQIVLYEKAYKKLIV